MNRRVTALEPDDLALFAEMRGWVRGMVDPEHQVEFDDDPEFKIAVVQHCFEHNAFASHDVWPLQALGLVFGDAIALRTGTSWVISTIDDFRLPVLNLAGTSLDIAAFSAFEKRVHFGEEIDVIGLFNGFCEHIERCKSLNNRPWYKKIFGERLM